MCLHSVVCFSVFLCSWGAFGCNVCVRNWPLQCFMCDLYVFMYSHVFLCVFCLLLLIFMCFCTFLNVFKRFCGVLRIFCVFLCTRDALELLWAALGTLLGALGAFLGTLEALLEALATLLGRS